MIKSKKSIDDWVENSNPLKIMIFIICFLVLVFFQVFTTSSFLTYDDNWYIYENSNVINSSWASIKNMFTEAQGGQYSPLGELYHFILYAIFGKNAVAFKISAFVVHLLNSLLLYTILKKLFNEKLLIIFVVLIFGIHPMQVETIGWISVIFRNAVFFMFLGYHFYLKYLENDSSKIIDLFPVLLFFILALLVKEQAILFPAGILLIHLIKSKKKFKKSFLVEMTFWSVISLVYGLITIQVTKTGGPSLVDSGESFFEKLALLSKTIIDYSTNFFFPLNLSFSYPYLKNGVSHKFFWIIAAVILLILCIYFSIKNRKILFGVLWVLCFMSLSYLFAFFHLRDSYMADRYIYLAIVGYGILSYELLKSFVSIFKNNISLTPILGIFILGLGIMSFKRVEVFKNSEKLWSDAIKANPKNQFAYNSLGYYYRNENKLDTAFTLYKKALEIDPKYYLAHSNIGKIYYNKKKYDSALYHVSKAIEINPSYKRAYENRAAIFSKTKKENLLLNDLNKILEFEPQQTKYLTERAKILFKQKKYADALIDLQTLVKLKPKDQFINYLLGHTFLLQNNFDEAIVYLDKAISVNSKNAAYHYIRATAHTKRKSYTLALKDLKKAKKLGYKVSDIQLLAVKLLAKKSPKNKLN